MGALEKARTTVATESRPHETGTALIGRQFSRHPLPVADDAGLHNRARISIELIRRRARWRRLAAFALIALGLWTMGSGMWIHGKAWLAQVLIERAWAANRAHHQASFKPWGWADTTPVARITFVQQARSLIVLAGDSGRTLAFGPGHRTDSPLPGMGGNSVISGHRDTHFAVLRELAAGDTIEVEALNGSSSRYEVLDALVVDRSALRVTLDRGRDELTLVTCWPFDALHARGPLRYVVRTRRLDTPITAKLDG